MTPRSVGGIIILLLSVLTGFEISHMTGIVHSTRKNGYGCLCHSFDPSTNVGVWIAGPDSLAAGERGLYSISVSRNASIAAGFNVAAWLGGLDTVVNSQVDSLEGELTHRWPKFAGGRDTISWLFYYRAPALPGFVDTIYSAGNSVNNDSLPNEADHWAFGENFLVHVRSSASAGDETLAREFRLHQNYPNPFNPGTKIRFEVPAAVHVRLRVYDVGGRFIREILNDDRPAGIHEVEFTAGSTMASGAYFYALDAGRRRLVGKMVLAR